MSVPRDLNFIDHTSDLGWKESVYTLRDYIDLFEVRML